MNVIQALTGCAFSSIFSFPFILMIQLNTWSSWCVISDFCLYLEVNKLSDGSVVESSSDTTWPVTRLFSSVTGQRTNHWSCLGMVLLLCFFELTSRSRRPTVSRMCSCFSQLQSLCFSWENHSFCFFLLFFWSILIRAFPDSAWRMEQTCQSNVRSPRWCPTGVR